jgi:hypothetical protein
VQRSIHSSVSRLGTVSDLVNEGPVLPIGDGSPAEGIGRFRPPASHPGRQTPPPLMPAGPMGSEPLAKMSRMTGLVVDVRKGG